MSKTYYIIRTHGRRGDPVAFIRSLSLSEATDIFTHLPCSARLVGHTLDKIEDGREMPIAVRDGQFDYWYSDDESALLTTPSDDVWAAAE